MILPSPRPAQRAAVLILASSAFSAPAVAQGINLDFNDTFTILPSPAASYAAAGTAGVWNGVTLPAAAVPLVDKAGAATSVTVTTDPSFVFSLAFDNINMVGDDANLLEDLIYGGGAGSAYPITFNGLANGTYDVYTYAIASDNKAGFITDVDVIGSTSGVQAVGGFTFTGHAQGVSYALHTVSVTTGTLTVTIAINTGDLSVNGIQIEPSGDHSGASDCDCSGGNSPCFNVSGSGRGCMNSNGNGLGAMLTGSGNADSVTANDTFALAVIDAAPNKPGLILAGTGTLGPFGATGIANSAGVLCVSGSTARGFVVSTDANGAASFPNFQGAPFSASGLVGSGVSVSYTYWFRDPGTAVGCTNDGPASDFNFSNGHRVMWL